MTTDFRALCAELSDALRNAIRVVYHEDGTQHISTAMPILRRARAALADEPAVPSPTVIEIIELSEEIEAVGLGQVDFARAVLARWGNNVPAPLANGEVAELTGKLVEAANGAAAMGWDQHAQRILRAAELLQRLSPPQPVAVSKRPPEDQLCWWFEPDEEDDEAYGSSWTLLRICGGTSSYTHWLPAHALPIPQQQQEDHL